MLQQIQEYLFQYNSVTIPEVGSLRLSPEPALLDVANQELRPPSCSLSFAAQGTVPAHQLQCLATGFDNDPGSASEALDQFGKGFKAHLSRHPFHWQGLGNLAVESDGRVHFQPNEKEFLLLPVPAQRVLRENVAHTVLVGDQEMQYTTEAYEAEVPETGRRSWAMILGWILALCAAAFIAYHLYQSQWLPDSSGLQRKPIIQETPLQHR